MDIYDMMNMETDLNSLSDDSEYIGISSKYTESYFPELSRFTKLERLHISNTQIISLPELPNTLQELICYYNDSLSSLPVLPNTLMKLHCFGCKITYLPSLSNTLRELYCFENQLTSLPETKKEK